MKAWANGVGCGLGAVVWLHVVLAAAEVTECPSLPVGVEQVSDAAMALHCEHAGRSCSVGSSGVTQCGGLACIPTAPDSELGNCQLPVANEDCRFEPPFDVRRAGGYCNLEQSFVGKSCQLEAKESLVTELGGPDDDPGDGEPSKRYVPTQYTVDEVCGGLGCIHDPTSDDETRGVCGLARTERDCGGRANPELYGGRCGPAHLDLRPPVPIIPRRYLVTGSYQVDFGNDSLGSDIGVGGIFQIGLHRSKTRRLPNGATLHFGLPSFYLHGAALVSQRRFAQELGIVFKTGAEFLTRVGVAGYGQFWAPDDLVSTSTRYGVGPSLHVELFYNILARGVWLLHEDNGPRFTVGLQYAATLFDDFK